MTELVLIPTTGIAGFILGGSAYGTAVLVVGAARLRGSGRVVVALPRSRRVPAKRVEPRADAADEVRLDGVQRGVARPCGVGIPITPLVGTPEATG